MNDSKDDVGDFEIVTFFSDFDFSISVECAQSQYFLYQYRGISAAEFRVTPLIHNDVRRKQPADKLWKYNKHSSANFQYCF